MACQITIVYQQLYEITSDAARFMLTEMLGIQTKHQNIEIIEQNYFGKVPLQV